jgi:hypothetical protein
MFSMVERVVMTDEFAKTPNTFWPSGVTSSQFGAPVASRFAADDSLAPPPPPPNLAKSAAARLRERREKLDRQAAMIARKRARLEVTERRIDTRRKILLGAWALKHLQNPALATLLKATGPAFFAQERDREILADLLGKD